MSTKIPTVIIIARKAMRQAAKRQATRQSIIDAAGRSFRRHGFSGIGVDAIAKAAGATSGAFYDHMGSKGAAFRVALEVGLDEVIEAIPTYQNEHGESWVDAFIEYYLGQSHREDMACGCAMTALSPDVMRGDHVMHALYEDKMLVIVGLITDGLTGNDNVVRAWSFLQVLIGGLIMSRSVNSADVSDRIADAAKITARNIAAPREK
jgi:AcrR family transcriptional regulator